MHDSSKYFKLFAQKIEKFNGFGIAVLFWEQILIYSESNPDRQCEYDHCMKKTFWRIFYWKVFIALWVNMDSYFPFAIVATLRTLDF